MPSEHTPKRGRHFYGPGPYITREADETLFEALRAGEYALVLGPGGSGKTSLRVHTHERLLAAEVRVATVDLGAIGAESRPEAFYASLLIEAGRSLGLAEQAKKAWRRSKGPPQMRLRACLREVVLEASEAPVVLFVDEFELLRALGPARDDFFAALRAMADARGHDPVWRRLSVCLIGALTRDELVSDPRRSALALPARELSPRDFSREQLDAFTPVLDPLGAHTKALLDALFEWTGGHPALCQWIAGDLLLREVTRGEEASAVEAVVRESFLQRGPELDPLLGDTARRLRRDQRDPWRTRVLAAYERVLRGERVDLRGRQLGSEGALIVARLRVAGLVGADRSGKLRVRNKVIERAFDRNWVRKALAGRPVTDALERWETNRRRPGYLLRGAALERAITWLEGRPDVTPGERDFVMASEQARARRLRRWSWAGSALSLGLAGLLGGALWQYREVLDAPLQTTVDHARAGASDISNDGKAEPSGAEPATFVTQTRQAVELAAGGATAQEVEDMRGEIATLAQLLAIEQAQRAALLAPDPRRRNEGLTLALTAIEPWAGALEQAPAPVTRALTANLAGPGDTLLIPAHDGPIELLAVGPGHAVTVARLLEPTMASSTELRVWSLSSGQRLASFESPAGALTHVAISPGGRRIAALSASGALTAWDLADGSAHGPAPILPPIGLEAQLAPVALLRIDDGGTVKLLRRDASVDLVDPSAGNSSARLSPSALADELPLDHVGVLDPSLTQKARVAMLDGEDLELWDPQAGRILASVPAPTMATGLRGLELLPGARSALLLANAASALILWHIDSGVLQPIAEQPSTIVALARSADGRLIATGTQDGAVRLWTPDGLALAEIADHDGPIAALAFTGDALISADRNGALRIEPLRDPSAPAPTLARLSPAGERQLLGRSGSQQLWIGALSGLAPIDLDAPVDLTAVDLAATRVAVRFEDGRAALFATGPSAAKGAPPLLQLEGRILDLALSLDGRLLVSAGEDRRVSLWSADGQPIATLAGHEAPVDRLALAADGSRLVSVDRSRSLRIWDPRTAAALATLEVSIAPARMTATAQHVLLVDADGVAELWSLDERRRLARLELGREPISALALANAGTAIAVARPGGVELWRVDAAEAAGDDPSSDDPSSDDPGSGEAIGWFRASSALALAFADDDAGDLLVVDGQGVISRWPTQPARWLRAACDSLPSGTVLPAACPVDD